MIEFRTRTLYFPRNHSGTDLDREHLPAPRIRSAPLQTAGTIEALENSHAAPCPPALPEPAALGMSANAALRFARDGRGKRVPAAPLSHTFILSNWILFTDRVLAECKQILQLGVGKFGQPPFAGPDD